MKVLLEPCYILHTRDYRESSLLLQVLSMHHGRLDLAAKGAKHKRNRHRHLYQPWQHLLLSWSMRGDLGTLTAIETDSSPQIDKAELVYCGFYLNEIVLRLLHLHEPHPELFAAYHGTLEALHAGQESDVVLRYFEKHLLQFLGYGLILDRDVDHETPLQIDTQYFYAYERGPQRKHGAREAGTPISGRALLALHAETLADEARPVRLETKQLMRAVLERHLNGACLASRELYGAWLTTQGNRQGNANAL